MATRSKCIKCRSKFDGKGSYCLQCVSSASTLLDGPVRKKVRPGPQARVAKDDGGPICPHCKLGVSWDSMGSIETEISIYVREKLYFCSACRSVLGISSWHTEG